MKAYLSLFVYIPVNTNNKINLYIFNNLLLSSRIVILRYWFSISSIQFLCLGAHFQKNLKQITNTLYEVHIISKYLQSLLFPLFLSIFQANILKNRNRMKCIYYLQMKTKLVIFVTTILKNVKNAYSKIKETTTSVPGTGSMMQ